MKRYTFLHVNTGKKIVIILNILETYLGIKKNADQQKNLGQKAIVTDNTLHNTMHAYSNVKIVYMCALSRN